MDRAGHSGKEVPLIRHTLALLTLALVAAAGCGGPKDPSSVKDSKISSLSEEDTRGICAHNIQAFRTAIPHAEWNTAFCAGLVVLEILAYEKVMEQHGTKVPRDECAAKLDTCLLPPPGEAGEPESDCQRAKVETRLQCNATVADLQACIEERIARIKEVDKIVADKTLCDAPDRVKAVDPMLGPACMKMKTECPDFRLGLPGRIDSIH